MLHQVGEHDLASVQQSRVLVVEDEPLIGLDITETLREAGYDVVGPFRVVAPAVHSLACQRVAAAVIDLNLGTDTTRPLAAALASRGIPFIWLTGYGRDALPREYRDRPLISKPFDAATLLAGLAAVGVVGTSARQPVGNTACNP